MLLLNLSPIVIDIFSKLILQLLLLLFVLSCYFIFHFIVCCLFYSIVLFLIPSIVLYWVVLTVSSQMFFFSSSFSWWFIILYIYILMSQFHKYKTFQVILDLHHVLIHFFIFVCLFVSKVMSVGPPTKMSCDNSGGLYSELIFRKLLFFLLAAFCSNINGQKWRSSVCLLLKS